MNQYTTFKVFLICCLPLLPCGKVRADSAVFWQQQQYQSIFFDFNRDQIPDLLLQTKSDAAPSLLVLGEYNSRSELVYLEKNSKALPAQIYGMSWSADDAQLLPIRSRAAGSSDLLVIFPKQQNALMIAGNDHNFNFNRPLAKFQSSQWPFLANVDDFELHTGDFDNDGVDEILQLAKLTGEHQILKIQNNYGLSTQRKIDKKVAWGLSGDARIIIRDFDNDGFTDIFALAKSPGLPHYLIKSGKNGDFRDIEGEAIAPTLGGLPWFEQSSGTVAVKLLEEQRPVLLRLYNHDELAVATAKECIGWLYDPLHNTSQEYCHTQQGTSRVSTNADPVLSSHGQKNISQFQSPQLDFCDGDGSLFKAALQVAQQDERVQNPWCPPPIPVTPSAAPQISGASFSVNQSFMMQLPNTGDNSALIYEVFARNAAGVEFKIAESLSPMLDTIPSVTASAQLSIAGIYQLKYRSCREGCSGFGPATTVSINAAPVEHLVATASGVGGTISPTSRRVPTGSSTTFIITPYSGYRINTALGCNGWPSGNTYTTGAITADCTVSATFALDPVYHTVSTNAGAGGSISPTSRTVQHGSSTTFTITPNNGYRINSTGGCNGWPSGNTYTTGTITAACNVGATFELIPVNHTVSTNVGAGGTISPTSRTVPHGSSTSFTIIPNQGFVIDTAKECNGTLSGTIYSTGIIQGACTVKVTFKPFVEPPKVLYLHTDVLGSVIAESDSTKKLKTTTQYKPFGEVVNN